jgi:uncharacterized membrane protein YiaA
MGVGFIVAGFLMFAVGVWIWTQNPHSGLSFTSIGFSVLALGATTIIKARGRGQVNTIRNGAWSVIGIAVAALIIGLFVYFSSPLRGA